MPLPATGIVAVKIGAPVQVALLGPNKVKVIVPVRLPWSTFTVTEFAVPTGGSGPDGITAGPDGNLWFTEQQSIGRAVISATQTAADLAITTSHFANFHQGNVDNYANADVKGTRTSSTQGSRILSFEGKSSWDKQFTPAVSSALVVGGQLFSSQLNSNAGTGSEFPAPGIEVTGA